MPGGRRARWMASSMVVAELALTIVLLAGAGLMIRSFMKLYSMDIGVDTTRMLTMRLALPDKKYPTPEKRRLFYEALAAASRRRFRVSRHRRSQARHREAVPAHAESNSKDVPKPIPKKCRRRQPSMSAKDISTR